jgi:hypothetical protein
MASIKILSRFTEPLQTGLLNIKSVDAIQILFRLLFSFLKCSFYKNFKITGKYLYATD